MAKNKKQPTLAERTEAEGIKAIIALQAFAGIVETEEEARAGWRGMTEGEKRNTMAAHAIFCGSK